MDEPSAECPGVSFPDVLRCLTSQAADFLIRRLRRHEWMRAPPATGLAAVRQACRALRSFVDANTTALTLTVRPGARQRWAAGRLLPPPLTLWPRCHDVTVVAADGRVEDDDEAALLVLLPLAGQPREALLRITTLRARSSSYLDASSGEGLVCLLAQLLPNLRELDFQMPGTMSYNPLRQQLMYDALAALPYMFNLTLPGCRCLDRVGAIADCTSLCGLYIEQGLNDSLDDPLSSAAAAGLARLQQLSIFAMPDFVCDIDASIGLRALFRGGFQPSLTHLGLQIQIGEAYTLHDITLRGGRFSRVDLHQSGELQARSLAALADLLLSSPGMGPTLDHLDIDELSAFGGEQRPRGQAEEAQLRELLQRCARVRTYRVSLPSSASATDTSVLLGLLPLLGAGCVQLGFLREKRGQELYLSLPGVTVGTSGPDEGVAGAGPRCGGTPPDPSELLRAALQRWAAADAGASGQQRTGGDDAASTAEGTGGRANSGGSSGASRAHLVLLQGLEGVFLAAKPLGAIRAGVRYLVGQTAAAPAEEDWGGQPARSYQALPAAAAVLLSCASAGAAAAVVAAASRLAAGAATPMAGLEVTLVHAAEDPGFPRPTVVGCGKRHVFWALHPVMLDFWEGSAHGGGGCSWSERLECLLALREQFKKLPKEVVL